MISKINTCGFDCTLYQPIPSAYENNITYLEFCLNLAKAVNEMIDEVNELSESVTGFDDRIKAVEDLVSSLNAQIANIQTELLSKVSIEEFELGLNALKVELQNLIIENYNSLKAYSDAEDEKLQYQIDHFSADNIQVYDPTTGLLSPLNVVLDNIFDSTRDEAITAGGYDALEITAGDYDALEITAINYDRFGKTILES